MAMVGPIGRGVETRTIRTEASQDFDTRYRSAVRAGRRLAIIGPIRMYQTRMFEIRYGQKVVPRIKKLSFQPLRARYPEQPLNPFPLVNGMFG